MTAIHIDRSPVGFQFSQNALHEFIAGALHAQGIIALHEFFTLAVDQLCAHADQGIQPGRAEAPWDDRHSKIFHIGQSGSGPKRHGFPITGVGRTHPDIETQTGGVLKQSIGAAGGQQDHHRPDRH